MDYNNKYLKYKKKYLELKTQIGGGCMGNAHRELSNHAITEREQNCQNNDCAICLEPLTLQKMAKLLCGHIYRVDCVVSLLRHIDSKCPICRSPTENTYFTINWVPNTIENEPIRDPINIIQMPMNIDNTIKN